jgi:hypothetical protein
MVPLLEKLLPPFEDIKISTSWLVILVTLTWYVCTWGSSSPHEVRVIENSTTNAKKQITDVLMIVDKKILQSQCRKYLLI